MKNISVAFANKKLLNAYNYLKKTKEDENLLSWINKAITELKISPNSGIKIQKKLWPREYKEYNITNLWKYNLPQAWRLIYTIKNDEIEIISMILEWMNHKDYEKRFNYK